jgi:hypothetical protein
MPYQIFAAVVFAMGVGAGCAHDPSSTTPEAIQQEIRLGMPEARFLQAFPQAKPISQEGRSHSYLAALPNGCNFCASVGGFLDLKATHAATFEFEDGRLKRALDPEDAHLPLKPVPGAIGTVGKPQSRGRPVTWW